MAYLLVVDDEKPVRDMLKLRLEGFGHKVREAGDAQSALAALAQEPADVVLCDVQMPGEDGLWLTNQIRNRYPFTAVVLATAVTSIAPSISMQKGVMAYLVKPFSARALADAVVAAVKWTDEAKVAGPRAEDRGDALAAWLDSLKDL